MIGDNVVILETHRNKANLILTTLLKKYNSSDKFILVIAGESGTGKTEVGYVLQEQLWKQEKLRSKCIHIDDYYLTTWRERNRVRKRTGIIGKNEVNWKKLNSVLSDFKQNKEKLHVQRIHKYINSIEHTISPTKCIDILIVEGLYALYADTYDLGIYLEGSERDTYEFRKMRAKENPDNKFRIKIIEKESHSVRMSKNRADKLISWRIK